eukprot:311832_1
MACKQKRKYLNIMNKYENNTLNVDNININSILMEFIHQLTNHNESTELFGFCTSVHSKCNKFKRNYRDRHIETNGYNTVNTDNTAVIQILDKIHCFHQHSLDMGHRLNAKDIHEQTINNENIDDEFKQKFVNGKIIKTTEILCQQNKINTLSRSKKYQNLFLQTNDIVDDGMYKFGQSFLYGYDGEEINDYINYISIKVSQKYSTFKEELTHNKICAINVEQFTNEYCKAQIHFNSFHRKQKYPSIALQYLLSLMIYCNYTHLQSQFSKTYYLRD